MDRKGLATRSSISMQKSPTNFSMHLEFCRQASRLRDMLDDSQSNDSVLYGSSQAARLPVILCPRFTNDVPKRHKPITPSVVVST
jgi:hypothetical protein